jgi:adenylate kinase family enzyme
MKITIIGSGGGGKSTLARKISMNFTVPRLELDRIWFSHNGHKVMNGTPEEKALVQEKLRFDVEKFLNEHESWVCDGTYSKIQPLIADQADYVVLIKRPLYRRMISHIKRNLQNDGRHPEVTRGSDLLFVKTIIKRWWKGEDVKIAEFSKQYSEKLVVLRSFKEIDTFFLSLRQ